MRILFTSQGHTALVDPDAPVPRYLAFDFPAQETWQPAAAFSDGRWLLLLSMEARRDGSGKPFAEYYHHTPTHIWICDLEDDARMLVQVVRDEGGRIYNVSLDGTDARPITQLGEGLPYGFDLSPDATRPAYHLASPPGYQIWTSDPYGQQRQLAAGHDDWLFFAPKWSPDGAWLAYQGCLCKGDPGHDWADLWIARPDGSQQRRLTNDQALWFAASYGPRERHGGGFNMPVWMPDGARVPWGYQPQWPDVDHFNRDFVPEQARGGEQIRSFDIDSGTSEALTEAAEGIWDFRQSASPDGKQLLFCRAPTGAAPTICVAGAEGEQARPLTQGWRELGADHPRWL